jgi:hypothetical protein
MPNPNNNKFYGDKWGENNENNVHYHGMSNQ